MKENKSKIRCRKYSSISYEKRLKLIELIINEGFSTNRAAKKLRVNPETAKVILRNFKKYGHIFQRKSQKFKIQSPLSENNLECKENISLQNQEQTINYPILWQMMYFYQPGSPFQSWIQMKSQNE